MFSHMMVGSNDIGRAKSFYDALFGALGGESATVDPVKNRLIYRRDGAALIVTQPLDGKPATPSNGATIGFVIDSPERVDAWHAAGAANGGQPVEDPPGWRERPGYRLYLAYLRDPDGNKLCAYCRPGD